MARTASQKGISRDSSLVRSPRQSRSFTLGPVSPRPRAAAVTERFCLPRMVPTTEAGRHLVTGQPGNPPRREPCDKSAAVGLAVGDNDLVRIRIEVRRRPEAEASLRFHVPHATQCNRSIKPGLASMLCRRHLDITWASPIRFVQKEDAARPTQQALFDHLPGVVLASASTQALPANTAF